MQETTAHRELQGTWFENRCGSVGVSHLVNLARLPLALGSTPPRERLTHMGMFNLKRSSCSPSQHPLVVQGGRLYDS